MLAGLTQQRHLLRLLLQQQWQGRHRRLLALLRLLPSRLQRLWVWHGGRLLLLVHCCR